MISRWLSISDQHAIAPRFIFRSIDLFLYYLLFFLFPDFVCFSLSLSLSLSLPLLVCASVFYLLELITISGSAEVLDQQTGGRAGRDKPEPLPIR